MSQSIWPLVVAGMGAAFGYGCSTVLACIHGRGRRLGVALLLCVPFATLLAMTCKPHPLAKAAASADDAERINRAQAKFGALIVQELEIGRRQ